MRTYTTEEASKVTGMVRPFLWKKCNEGKFPLLVKAGSPGHIALWDADGIDRWVETTRRHKQEYAALMNELQIKNPDPRGRG